MLHAELPNQSNELLSMPAQGNDLNGAANLVGQAASSLLSNDPIQSAANSILSQDPVAQALNPNTAASLVGQAASSLLSNNPIQNAAESILTQDPVAQALTQNPASQLLFNSLQGLFAPIQQKLVVRLPLPFAMQLPLSHVLRCMHAPHMHALPAGMCSRQAADTCACCAAVLRASCQTCQPWQRLPVAQVQRRPSRLPPRPSCRLLRLRRHLLRLRRRTLPLRCRPLPLQRRLGQAATSPT